MEIPEGCFFLFWALISVIFLKLGFNTIDNTELSNSVPPIVMFLFKHSFAMFTCYSSIHAFFIRPQINKSVNVYLLISVIFLKLGFDAIDHTEISISVFPLVMFLSTYFSAILSCFLFIHYFLLSQIKNSVNIYLLNFTFGIFILVYLSGGSWTYCCLPIYTVTTLYNLFLIIYDYDDFASDPKYKWKLVIHVCFMVSATILAVPLALGLTDSDTPVASGIGFLQYANWLYELEGKRSGESLPSTHPEHDQNLTIFAGNTNNNYKIKKSIEFAGGLLGTIVFQNFFRLNSFKEVVAFLYFAVAWLADVTLLSPSHDLGVFNFLLANAIVGCSVSEFGLGGNTWIAYAAAVFLFCLRLKIQSLSFVNRGGNCKVILW